MNDAIQGLWIGSSLSVMEQVSINSFLHNSHEYHLYVYDNVEGVPPGAILKDAASILPRERIFQYKEHRSYAGFADFFRYKLLLEQGGWWVDTDVVCIKHFAFESDHAFASERDLKGREIVTNGIIKAPKGSVVMRDAWQACQRMNTDHVKYGETGPTLIHNLVLRSQLCEYVQAPEVFCPIEPNRWFDLLLPGRDFIFEVNSVSIHLWNEFWRRMGLNKNETYAPTSLYEELKRRYLKAASGA